MAMDGPGSGGGEAAGDGGRTRRPRGGREPVTPGRVTDAALAIVDAEGLEALTMRRLAQELGVEPMTVYRQYPNKDAILASVAERLWTGIPAAPAPPEGASWREVVRAMWLGLHELMQAHPNAIPIIARGGSMSAAAATGTAGMVDVLRRAGFGPDEAGWLVHALSASVVGYGFATVWTREAVAAAGAGAPPPVPPPSVDAALLPYLALLGRWAPGEFEATLDRLLASVEPG